MMKRWMMICAVLVLAGLARAEDKPPVFQWTGRDLNNQEVTVPAARPTVLLFVRGEHAPSKQALEQLQGVVKGNGTLVVVILSGPQAAEQAKALETAGWPVVVDKDYAASGQMNVHVWPTTLVLKGDGTQVAHIAGMPKSYARDVEANLAFAAGKIDEPALQRRLTTDEVISDSPREKAARHLQIAQRLLVRGKAEQAKSELDEALKLTPEDGAVQLALAEALVQLNQPAEALAALDKRGNAPGPGWQAKLVRARALMGLERWEEAKAIVPEGMKLNPHPSEAHYLMGRIYEHEKNWEKAAESFRQAYESALAAPTAR